MKSLDYNLVTTYLVPSFPFHKLQKTSFEPEILVILLLLEGMCLPYRQRPTAPAISNSADAGMRVCPLAAWSHRYASLAARTSATKWQHICLGRAAACCSNGLAGETGHNLQPPT